MVSRWVLVEYGLLFNWIGVLENHPQIRRPPPRARISRSDAEAAQWDFRQMKTGQSDIMIDFGRATRATSLFAQNMRYLPDRGAYWTKTRTDCGCLSAATQVGRSQHWIASVTMVPCTTWERFHQRTTLINRHLPVFRGDRQFYPARCYRLCRKSRY